MNKFLRLEIKNWNYLLWFVFFAIGAQYFILRVPRTPQEMAIATVYGSKITAHELQRAMVQEKSMRDILAQYLGQKIDIPLNPDDVLRRMVQQEVVGYHAKKAGVRLSDNLVSQHIFTLLPQYVLNPDGSVNPAAYGEYVRSQGLTIVDFEKNQEKALVQSFMHNALYASVVLPHWMLQAEWEKKHSQKKYRIGDISFDSVRKEIDTNAITDDKLQSYFEAHKEMYKVPEERSISYAEISFEEYAKNIQFTEEEIKAYYDKYKERFFSQAPDASIREIYVPKGNDEKGAQALINTLYTQVKEVPGSFADLATKHARNEDAAKKKGLVSSIRSDEISEVIRRAALRLKVKGDVSGILPTKEAFILIQLEEKVEPVVKPLADVQQEVINRLKGSQPSRMLVGQMRQLIRAARDDVALIETRVKEMGGIWKKMKLSASEKRNKEGALKNRLSQAAFGKGLKEGSVNFVQTPESITIFKVEQIAQAEIPTFKQVKDAVFEDYVAQEVRKKTKEKARDIHQKVLQGSSLESLNIVSQSTSYLDEKELKAKVKARNKGYSEKMALLSDVSQVLRHHDNDGYYIVQLEDAKAEAEFPKTPEAIATEFALHKEAYREMWLGLFIAYLEKNATIVYNIKNLQ